MGFCWIRYTLFLCLIPLFSIPAAANGLNVKEKLEVLLRTHGKDEVVWAVLKLRKNRITLWVNGRFLEFTGPPSLDYVTPETLMKDLEKAGVGVEQIEETISSGRPAPSEIPGPSVYTKPKEIPLDELKQAALECQITAFSEYMSPSTRSHVERVEEVQKRLTEALEEFYRISRGLFRGRVSASHGVVRFTIEGKDPRWVEILGQQWERLLKDYPDQPRFLMIMAEFGWEEECKVVQRFQSCLEDRRYCQEFELNGSALRLTQRGSSWILEDAKPAREWNQAIRMGEGLIQLLQWASAYLSDSRRKEPYEELMISFAGEYTDRLHDLMKSLQFAP